MSQTSRPDGRVTGGSRGPSARATAHGADASGHPAAISLDERRRGGVVYTPAPLARFVLDQAGCIAESPEAPVLDPACGAAVFLCEVLERAARRIGEGDLPLAGVGRQALLSFAVRNLFGIDVDPAAQRLALAALRDRFQHLAPGPLPPDFLGENVVRDDFLTGDAATRMGPTRDGGFAFVVGNPPYVSTTRLPVPYRQRLRALFTTAGGRVDLYTLFFERALPLLRADGVLGLITPDKFLTSETSGALRALLAREASLLGVATFRSHRVFRGAAVVPCVTAIGRRRDVDDHVRVLTCSSTRDGEVRVAVQTRVPRRGLGRSPWYFRPPELVQIVERLRAAHPSLSSLSRRISAGPATGRDDVYVRPAGELDDVEPELLRPAVRGRDISPLSIRDAGLRVLLPYTFDDGRPCPIALSRFPRARRYLERHREALEARHCVRIWRKAWFDLHDLPATDLAATTKIVVPDVADRCRFAVDRGRFFPLHSAYYVVFRDEGTVDYVAAILNSTVVEFALRLLSPVAKDGFSRFRRQFLKALPVPSADADERRDVARLARTGAEEATEEASDRVARLYGVSPGELRVMSDHLAELRRDRR